jgi:hypothetical protein
MSQADAVTDRTLNLLPWILEFELSRQKEVVIAPTVN